MAVENKYFKLFYRNKYFGLTIVTLSIIIIISTNKLLNFIELIPEGVKNANHSSDAIVVLTGGNNRLKRGLELLTEKKAKNNYWVKSLISTPQQKRPSILMRLKNY